MENPMVPPETYSTDADISGADGVEEEEEMEDAEGGDLVENAETGQPFLHPQIPLHNLTSH